MNAGSLFIHYLVWHYSHAFIDIARITLNFIWFWGHFFSLSTLARTFFSPWQGLQEEKQRSSGFDPEDLAARVVVNTIVRVVGAIARGFTILIGLLVICITAVLSVVVLLVWIALPVIVIWMISLFLYTFYHFLF